MVESMHILEYKTYSADWSILPIEAGRLYDVYEVETYDWGEAATKQRTINQYENWIIKTW